MDATGAQRHAGQPQAVLILAADRALRARLEGELTAPLPAAIVTTELAAVQGLRAAHPRLPLIVVSIGRSEIAAALDAGADAAIAGEPPAAELRARLRAVARRREPPIRVGALELHPRSHTACLAGAQIALSGAEFAILARLASAPGRVFTKGELAFAAGDGPTRSPSRALDRRLSRLRHRLGGGASMLVTVWGVGYRLDEPS